MLSFILLSIFTTLLLLPTYECKKVIAVMGATGAQGGALVKYILEDPSHEFTCRALTRNINSNKARELKDKGCEVVEANADDVESLKQAFKGAHGVFGVTNYWEIFDVNKEIQQGKNIADAAKAEGVQHTIWSTLDACKDTVVAAKDTSFPEIHGWVVPHFDAKGEISKYFKQTGIPFTDYFTSFYMENLYTFGMLGLLPDGKWSITMNMGDVPMPMVAVDDIGRAALAIFKNKEKYVGKPFYIASDTLSIGDVAKKLSEKLGKQISYTSLTRDQYAGLGFPGADDLANMFHFKFKFPHIFSGLRDLKKCKELVPALSSFDSWVDSHKEQLLSYMKNTEEKRKQEQKEKKPDL